MGIRKYFDGESERETSRGSVDIPVFMTSDSRERHGRVLSLTDSQIWMTSQFCASAIIDLSFVRMAIMALL
jgi:hypothetical protein